LYTGQRLEAEIGLYFYNARFYDATLGRFAQADTIIPGAGNVLALDRYAYVQNNSLRYNDSSGHMPCEYANGKDSGVLPPPPPYYPKDPIPDTTNIQESYGDGYKDPGDHLYNIFVEGGERKYTTVYFSPDDEVMFWTLLVNIDYQASYVVEVHENGMYIVVEETYTIWDNTEEDDGVPGSQLVVSTDSGNVGFGLGIMEYDGMTGVETSNTRTSGVYWIDGGDINTRVSINVAVGCWQGYGYRLFLVLEKLGLNSPVPQHTYYFAE